MVSKVYEKFVNNRIVDHVEKCDIFSDFKFGLGLLNQLKDLLTIAFDRNGRAFIRGFSSCST